MQNPYWATRGLIPPGMSLTGLTRKKKRIVKKKIRKSKFLSHLRRWQENVIVEVSQDTSPHSPSKPEKECAIKRHSKVMTAATDHIRLSLHCILPLEHAKSRAARLSIGTIEKLGYYTHLIPSSIINARLHYILQYLLTKFALLISNNTMTSFINWLFIQSL